jgi:hypothetical protein
MTRRIFSIALIVAGSFLEIYYYAYRFTSDGIQIWLAVTIGVALTLLLSLAVFQRKQKWAIWIIIPVALYSIFATSAGQAFSLGEVLRAEATIEARSRYVLDEIADAEKQIAWIDSEIERLSREIDATTNSLEERYEWKNTLAKAEARQDELSQQRRELAMRLTELRGSAQEHESVEKRSRNIYIFYGDMLNWSEEWLQFFLQTILSAFIAVMAPIGIMTYPKSIEEKAIDDSEPISEPVERLPRNDVEKWIRINWIGIRTGRSKKILGQNTYVEFLNNRGEKFNQAHYDKLLETAKRARVIADDRRIIEKDEKNALKMMISVDK